MNTSFLAHANARVVKMSDEKFKRVNMGKEIKKLCKTKNKLNFVCKIRKIGICKNYI